MKKKKLTAADVWAIFAETGKRMQETDCMIKELEVQTKELRVQTKEIEAQTKELRVQTKEIEAQTKELRVQTKEIGEQMKELGIQVGGINDNIGHHAEQFFQDIFKRKLEFGRMKYDEMVPNLIYKDKGVKIEFDIALLNGDSIALIEVKNRIHPDFVKELAEERIENFRKFFPRYNDYRAYLGIAGFSFCDEVLEQASRYGIGIVKQVGEGVEVKADSLRAY